MLGAAPYSPFTQVPGWESEAEQALLVDLARKVPANGIICEIGSEWGMSASLFCYAADSSVSIHCVDLFPIDYRGDMQMNHALNLHYAGFSQRVFYLRGDSSEIGKIWQGGAIDLLFIDGDHSYNGVLRDIEAWLPHIAKGGIVAFHDTAAPTNANPHALHFEVDQALATWLDKDGHNWLELPSVDSIRVFQRVAKHSKKRAK